MLSMFVCIGQHGISLVLLIVDVLISAATDLSVAAAYNYPEGTATACHRTATARHGTA